MNALRLTDPARAARQLIEDAIAANGARRVLFAAVFALFRPPPAGRARPPDLSDLGPHLRRDIGLPMEPHAPDPIRLLLR